MNQVYGPFLSREQALDQGLSWYFDGRSCKHDHIAPTHVKGGCRCCRIITATRWQQTNKEAANQAAARYRASEKGKETLATWTGANTERIREVGAARERRYRRDKTNRAIAAAIGCQLRAVLKGRVKSSSATKLLGCTIADLRNHIERQWLPGMSWENWSREGWHIDHIIPCSSFDLSQEEDQYKCFHFSNLQPLWAADNMKKGTKLPDSETAVSDTVTTQRCEVKGSVT
jgi:hypothetical protein